MPKATGMLGVAAADLPCLSETMAPLGWEHRGQKRGPGISHVMDSPNLPSDKVSSEPRCHPSALGNVTQETAPRGGHPRPSVGLLLSERLG